MPRLLTGFILLAAVFHVNAGDIHKCKADNGKITFSDQPCEGSAAASSPATNQELSLASLQGQWLITHVGDIDTRKMDLGTDIWEFKDDQYIVISNGHRMRPDPFNVKDDVIDLGYAKITVLEFSPTKMKVKTLGVKQTLERM